MTTQYKFDCSCVFEINKELVGYEQPRLKFDYYKSFNEECPAVWSTFKNGLTLGVFQLESNLGKKYCKLLQPENIEHLSALTAILRPGALGNLLEDDISVTEHYCKRKNRLEPVEYPIPALEPILKDTYGLLIYQESSIRLGIEIAGFSQGDADYYLRKSIGVKDAKLLFSAEEKFINGCKQVGKVNEEQAKTIFGWIKASARYAFNKSISPESIVITKNGEKKLRDISVGDKILAPIDNNCYNFDYVTVKNIFDHGVIPTVHVLFDTGISIDCTINHKFSTSSGVLPLWEIISNWRLINGYNKKYDIISVTPTGHQRMMDIEVDSENHLFLANNLISSNSHSVGYGIKAFQEMYLKIHDPLSFYTAKLRSPRSAFDQEDASNLIYEAKLLNINTKLPDIRHLRPNFYHDGQSIYFGLADIRDFGNSSFKQLCEVWKDHKDILIANFFDFAINAALLLSPSIVKLLIQSGAVDFFGHPRAEMLAEFELLSGLTKNEKEYLGKIYHAKKAGIETQPTLF